MATENTGVVLCVKDGKNLDPFAEDHPAAKLAARVQAAGGEITPRAAGFKMTGKDGNKLGFCQPTKDGFKLWLTCILHDNPMFKELLAEYEGAEVHKGSQNLAVVTGITKSKVAFAFLNAAYDKLAEQPKPKRERTKKVKANDDEKPSKKAKSNGEDKPSKKVKHEDDDDAPAPKKVKKEKPAPEASDDE